MGLNILKDEELKKILLTKDGLKNFIANKDNLKCVLGMDSKLESRLKGILEKEGLKSVEIKEKLDFFQDADIIL